MQGKCPNCRSENLIYETCCNDGDSLYYSFTCGDCPAVGKEWYALQFTEITLDNEVM